MEDNKLKENKDLPKFEVPEGYDLKVIKEDATMSTFHVKSELTNVKTER